MSITKIRGETQIIDETIKNIQIATDAAIALSKLAEAVLQADGGQALTGDWDLGGSFKITNAPTPTGDSDLVPKSYVDAKISGLSWQDPAIKIIHYVKTTAGAPSGTAIDGEYCLNTNEQKIYHYTSSWDAGVATDTGDRYLFAIDGSDTSGDSGTYTADNDIYEDTGASIVPTSPGTNWTLLVEDASYGVPADSQWSYNDDDLEWVRISGAGQIVAGSGLTKTGNTLNVGQNSTGAISVAADDIGINDDDSTLTVTGSSPGTLKVKDAGITGTQLDASVAGDGLAGGAGSPLSVGEGNGIDVTANAIAAKAKTNEGLGVDANGIYVNYDGDSIGIDGSNLLAVLVDDSSIAIDAVNHYLEIKDGGVKEPHLDCYDSPDDGDALTWNNAQSKFEWKPFAGTDEKAGVTASDTTPGYFDSKIAEGDGIITTVLNPAGDEDLEIKMNIDTAAGLKFDASSPKKAQVALNTTDGALVFDTGEIELNLAPSSGLEIVSNLLKVDINGSTLYLDGDGFKVADNGITADQIHTDVAGNGLGGGGGVNLGVGQNATGGITVGADDIGINDDDSTLTIDGSSPGVLKVKDAGINATQLHTGVAGAGLAGGGGMALSPDMVSMEVPEGTINGSNVTFGIASAPVSLNARVALFLILNGLVLEEGGANDYTISGSTITMGVAPKTGSKLIAFYFK